MQNKSPAGEGRADELMQQHHSKISQLSNVPQQLTAIPQWIVWQKMIKPDGKVDKVPKNHKSGRDCSVKDPRNYLSFEDAKACWQKAPERFDGVGFCLTDEAQIIGLDFDKALDGSGKPKPWASEILALLPDETYLEVSPSGHGLRAFLIGTLSLPGNRAPVEDGLLEIYGSKRFLTVTGNQYGAGTQIVAAQDVIDRIHGQWIARPLKDEPSGNLPICGHCLSDEEVLEAMFKSKVGAKIKRLWNGDISNHKNDDSAADQALLCHLAFWTGKNPEQMERLFSQSKLGKRDKWQHRQDYRERSIEKALLVTDSVYEPQKQSLLSQTYRNKLWSGEELLKAHFDPILWIVEGLIPEGLCILASPPKTGKSIFCLQLSIAAVTGGLMMGKFQASECNVIYYALEDSERRIQDRLLKMMGEVDRNKLANFKVKLELPTLENGGIEELEAFLTEHPDCKVIIIDTYQKVNPATQSQSNAYEKDYKTLSPLQALAMRFHVAVIVVTHLRKEETSDPLHRIMGSTAMTGAADTILLLKCARKSERGSLYVTGRDVEEEEYAIERMPDMQGWRFLGIASECRISQERQEVIDLLKDTDATMSPTEVAQVLSKTEGSIKVLLGKMAKAGQIQRTSHGKYGPATPSDVFSDCQPKTQV